MTNKSNFYNLGGYFESVVSNNPDNLAIKYIDQSHNLSYSKLNSLSNQFAHFLTSRGVKKNSVVAIINNKSARSFALMIACMKIGAAYTCIDEDIPKNRLKKILSTCKPCSIFSDITLTKEFHNYFQHTNLPLRFIDKLNLQVYSGEPFGNINQVTGATPAYIMFTSGSTGAPKGVVISHSSIISFIHWSIRRFSITTSDIFANVSPIYFDNAVFDIYTSLFSGACIAPIPKQITKKPYELVKMVDNLACTIWFSVPSLLIFLNTFKALDQESFTRVRTISFGGEGFPRKELSKIYRKYSHRTKFVNVYGPTEGTCICSSYDVCDSDFDVVTGILPLGHVNQNFDILILDEFGNDVPDGLAGELCLLGPNVALGYYNDTERTSLSFVSNPRQTAYSEIMYKSGDHVYRNPTDKLLYFVGRKDNQVKHMGYRIELDEVEHALNGLAAVTQAAVVYKRTNENYGKIFAFVSCDDNYRDEQHILASLKNTLPDYMLPNQLVFLDELPKNQNGKIDRQQLLNG